MVLSKLIPRQSSVFNTRIRRVSGSAIFRSPIIHAEAINSGNALKVKFSNGQNLVFPSLFLQDNCTCPLCFHSASFSRTRKMTQLNLNNVLGHVDHDGDAVRCVWSDRHESVFPEDWLIQRRFTVDNIAYRMTGFRDSPTLVGSNHEIYRVPFQEIFEESSSLLPMLTTLCEEGILLVTGAPKKVGQLKILADKIGFIRLTHYGYEFTVKSEHNAVNLAYTSHPLNLHTDLPYYVYPPGVQILHCIKQYYADQGGKSLLVDGFLVAEYMRQNHPKEYETLHQVPVEFYDVGKDYVDFLKVHHSPTFVLDSRTKRVTRINYSNQQFSTFQPIPLEQVDALYRAMKLFTDLCYKPEYLIQYKMEEGEILVFDNWRFLHGREGFDPSLGDRHLEGCYMDWDEIYSRIRILQKQRDANQSEPCIGTVQAIQ